MPTYRPFTARATDYRGIRTIHGTALKTYAIAAAGETCDDARFADGIALAAADLPVPDVDAGRPGVGLLILHAGRDVDYVVLGWWDRENELPLRVAVRERDAATPWRAARGGESVCVWDLGVIAAERDAYVATMLGGADLATAREAYLAPDISRS